MPALFYLPFAAVGTGLIIARSEFIGIGLWWLVASVVVGWLAMNFLALAGNQFMRRQLRRELNEVHPLSSEAIFVGYARPGFRSALDPHEDLGFLTLEPNHLMFVGEIYRFTLPRHTVSRVTFRMNPHTLVGLGRFVRVTGLIDGRPTDVLLEPREKLTLLGNLRAGTRLAKQIRGWVQEKAPRA